MFSGVMTAALPVTFAKPVMKDRSASNLPRSDTFAGIEIELDFGVIEEVAVEPDTGNEDG